MPYHIKKQSILMDSKTVYYTGDSKWSEASQRENPIYLSQMQSLRLPILTAKMVDLKDPRLSRNK